MSEPKTRKPRKVKPFTPKWEKVANALARGFAPEIYPCADCHGPVARGYCCSRCGSENPGRNDYDEWTSL